MTRRARAAATLASAVQIIVAAARPAAAQVAPAPGERPAAVAPLSAQEVIASVERAYPLIERARQDAAAARGAAVESRGSFDLKLKAAAETQSGDYDNTRTKTMVEQPIAPFGLSVFGGYRTGRGAFASYDEKALTLDGGEWSAGLTLPLLRDRAIDDRRTGLRQADAGVEAATASFARVRLAALRDALRRFWDWVAAGRQADVARALLALAERRDTDLADAVRLGQIAPVERLDNQRAILQRRAALVSAGRTLEVAAIELSLFYRAPDGTPVRASADRLPSDLPRPATALGPDEEAEVAAALALRPEVAVLQARRQQLDADAALARNALLPSLDLFADISRDVGAGKTAQTGRDLQAGLRFDLPLQRRKASGKRLQAEAKLAALEAELRLAQDRIRADVQDALSAVRAAAGSIALIQEELQVARQLETLERERFDLGDSTQFLVNLRELATADAAFRELRALADYQKALVDLDAATGRLGPTPVQP